MHAPNAQILLERRERAFVNVFKSLLEECILLFHIFRQCWLKKYGACESGVRF